MTVLITGSRASIGFIFSVTYRLAVLDFGGPVRFNLASSIPDLFVFDISETDANDYSIAVQVKTNNTESRLYLAIGSVDNGCATLEQISVGDIELQKLGFSTQGRAILSQSSRPRVPAGRTSRWYAMVFQYRSKFKQDVKYQIQAFRNSRYDDVYGWTLFMIFIPFLIACAALYAISVLATFRTLENCRLSRKPRVFMNGMEYRFKPRSQTWKSLFRGWFIGSDPKYLDNGEEAAVRRPFSFSWYTITVGFAFGVSTLQFVGANWAISHTTGDRDICFYNEKCYHPLRSWDIPWNNLVSNVPFMILGVMFNVNIAMYEKKYRARQDHSLFYALGWALVGMGWFSSFYHICPTSFIFQFDTAFMFAISSLGIIALFQTGEDMELGVRAPKFFLVYYVPLLFFNFLGVLAADAYVSLEGYYAVLIIWICIILTYVWHLFFVPRCRGCYDLTAVTRCLDCHKKNAYFCPDCDERIHDKREVVVNDDVVADHKRIAIPVFYKQWQFYGLMICCLMTILTFILKAVGAAFESTAVADLFLGIHVLGLAIYLLYKLAVFTRENSSKYSRYITICNSHSGYLWIMFAIGIVFGAFAMDFFTTGVTNKDLEPEASRAMNAECIWFGYFDAHDAWHYFAAIAVTIAFCIILHLNPPVNRMEFEKLMESVHKVEYQNVRRLSKSESLDLSDTQTARDEGKHYGTTEVNKYGDIIGRSS